MKWFAFILILLFHTQIGSGYDNRDSLKLLWEDASGNEVNRLDALDKYLVNEYIYSHPDSVIVLCQKALRLSKEKNLSQQTANTLNAMGKAYTYLGEYENAITHQSQSLALFESLKDSVGMTKSLNNLGNIYLKKSDYAKAINNFRKCQVIVERLGNKKSLATLTNNIGLVFMDLKNYEQATTYLTSSLELQKELENENGIANGLVNLGTVFRFQKELDKALANYNQALAIKQKSNSKFGLATCYSNIALIHQEKGNNKLARKFFDQSLQLHQATGNKKGIARGYIYYGELLEASHLDSTLYYAKKALKLAKETGDREEISDAAELLFRSYEANGQHKAAMEMQDLFHQTKEMMIGVENQRAVYENEHEYQQQQRELAANQKLENQMDLYISHNRIERILFFSVLILAAFFLGAYVKRILAKKDTEKEDLLQKIESYKKQLAIQSLSTPKKDTESTLALNKAKIEKAISTKLGESSWLILNLIFKNPSISNKEIAQEVSLSLEGVSSSLRRMYNSFNINSSGNKKITLIMKAIRISTES